MALARTATWVRLQSTDDLFYEVALADAGSGTVVPDADEATGESGTSDAYVALLGDDELVYRWSLATRDDGSVENLVVLSPDQDEESSAGLDIRLDSTWYRVSV